MDDFFDNITHQYVAKVVIDLSLDRLLEYAIPEKLLPQIAVGVRVEVPVKNLQRKGYVLDIIEEKYSEYKGKLRVINSVCEGEARIPKSLIALGLWMSQYYCCPQELAIRTLLPGSVRNNKIKPKIIPHLIIQDPKNAELFIQNNAKKKRQIELVKYLLNEPFGVIKRLFIEEHKVSAAVVKELLKSEVVVEENRPFASLLVDDEPELMRSQHLSLSAEQAHALQTIKQMLGTVQSDLQAPHTMLLFGVTGSGKTEVYLQAIDEVIKQGKEAIVVVPEIALTPQTVDRFKSRFGNEVSVLHSALTDKERYEQWNKINDGKVKIAVGARSVLFAPFTHLGLIIIDEEHEGTYKQSESPRYHARDVAVMRGHMERAVVILGSATPSFESYKNALEGRYILCELTQRADNCNLPHVEIIDMRQTVANQGPSIFSQRLIDAIYERLAHNEQIILFLNRRGFAKQLMCDACGFVVECPDCSVAMTYHQHNQTMMCHYCGMTKSAPTLCPDCGDKNIRYSGSGTEKIEQIAQKLFPYAKILRMDSDTMNTAEDYERALLSFRKGETNILLGTQMIAKGLHFPKVTLVGIINADMSLFVPDFRAEERTFQLITQVAGRAGRGAIDGEVFIQTRSPQNPAIMCAVSHDFSTFWKDESILREEMNNPPYSHMIVVVFRGEKEQQVADVAQAFFENISGGFHDELEALEPMVAPLERIKGKYRYMITIRGKKLARVRQLIRYEVCHGNYTSTVDIHADCDPVNMM